MRFLRFTAAALSSMIFMAFAAAPGHAANHFLAGQVPVLADPLLNSNVGDFDMAMSDSGEAVAFWGQPGGMYASVRPADGKFGPPVLISTNGSATGLPEVKMAPNGLAVLVWRGQDNLFNSQVYSSVKPAGSSTFTPAVQVSNELFSVPNVDPQVDVADNGTALVVWRGYNANGDPNSARIRRQYLNPDGSLSGAFLNVSILSPTGVEAPDVAVGPAGHSMITWVVGDTITGDAATHYNGPLGINADTQTFDTNSGWTPVAAVDASGTAVIAYKVGTAVIGNYRAGGPGHDFLFDQGLDGPGTNLVDRPVIGMDANGRATVAFGVASGGDWRIQSADRPAGSSDNFGTTTEAAAGSDDVAGVEIGVGANGAALLSWYRQDDRFYAASRDAGATQFSAETGPISPAVTDSGATSPVVDSQGRGIVSYSSSPQGGPIDYSIQALPYDDVPVATDLSVPATAVQGLPVGFSVSPTDAWAPVTATEWTLDAGLARPGNQVSHTYMTAGNRQVSVKLTDAMGNVTTTTAAINVKADKTPPRLTRVSIQKKKARVGKKNAFRFTVDDRSKIEITISRTAKGKKGGRRQGRIVKKNIAAGKRRIGFRGKIGKKKLKPGKYRAAIVAVDQFGNRSKPKNVGFTILR